MEDRLFEVEDCVELDYVENQRLNSSLCIRNVTDQVISFNVTGVIELGEDQRVETLPSREALRRNYL